MDNQTAGNSRVSFSLRSLLEVVAIVSLILALLYGKTDWLSSGNGRYQLHLVKEGNRTYEILLDSKTGQLWKATGGSSKGRQEWMESGPIALSPPASN